MSLLAAIAGVLPQQADGVDLAALKAEALLFSDPGDGVYAGGQVPPDTSGNHSDGQLGSTSGSDSNDPGFSTDHWTFDGNDYISWPDSTDWTIPAAADGHTRIIVARWASAQSSFTRILESGDGPSDRHSMWISSSTVSFRLHDGTTDMTPLTQAGSTGSTWQVITARVDASTAYLRLNGSESSKARPAGEIDTTKPLTVGRNANVAAQYFTGDVRLVAVWDRALTDAEVAAIEAAYG